MCVVDVVMGDPTDSEGSYASARRARLVVPLVAAAAGVGAMVVVVVVCETVVVVVVVDWVMAEGPLVAEEDAGAC